ncbi:MAG: chemotaxis protein CheA [Candidatus Thermoplasmatota archaeon]
MVNTSEYKEMFIEEAREHLRTINQALLDFEKNPQDKDALNQIFRAAHTLKGMSATMNYDKIQKLAHKTEDTLDLIRNNKIQIDSEIIDLIFKCFDGIEQMVEDIASQDMTEYDIVGLIEQLEKQIQNATGAPTDKEKTEEKKPETAQKTSEEKLALEPMVEQQIIKELQSGRSVYRIKVTISKTCAMKSIRAFILLKKLSDKGNLVYSKPDKKQIEDGEFEEGFELYLTTDQQQENIEGVVNSVSEIETKTITPLIYTDNTLQLMQITEIEKTSESKTESTLTKTQEQTTAQKKTKDQSKNVSNIQSIRIEMEQLDHFMNLIGELVISKGRLTQIAQDHKLDDLTETIDTIDRLTTELQDKIMLIRMIPMKYIFDRFPRMIRDLAKSHGKKINLIIEGEGIELDRTILDEIGDPLVHLLRNSVDHGIEPPEIRKQKGKPEEGTIELLAERTRNHIHIIIRDDGKGIDPKKIRDAAVKKGLKTREEVHTLDDKEALNLIFLPGLSTAEKVTNVSGRGVGMDVVKSTVERLNGSIEINSEVDQGTEVILKLPLTMAIFKSLFVGVRDETYAIPINNVIETIRLDKTQIEYIHMNKTTVLRGEVVPLISLAEILNVHGETKEEDENTIYSVIVQKEDKKIGLIVDKLIGEQEITIKNIGGTLKKTKGVAGVSIMGDGRVILVLDINTLL